MIEEARLERVASGLTPVTAGWFVVNARDAAWLNNDYFGGVCIFESDEFVLCGRPDLDAYEKARPTLLELLRMRVARALYFAADRLAPFPRDELSARLERAPLDDEPMSPEERAELEEAWREYERDASESPPRSDGHARDDGSDEGTALVEGEQARGGCELDEPLPFVPVAVGERDVEERVRRLGAGFTLRVVSPGQPAGLYHYETSQQEDFLVLTGECILIIEEQERHLRAWDFVHCPPRVAHTFVGVGDGPCVILGAGNRTEEVIVVRPRSELALRYGAGVEEETTRFPHEKYGDWRIERPERWSELPWSSGS